MNAQAEEVIDQVKSPPANFFAASEAVARPSGSSMLAEATVQREVAEIQARMLIARRFPRDPIKALDRILNACSRPSLAEVAVYQYARGGSNIDGPSIRLAEALAQCWGNISMGVTIVASDGNKSECIAYARDDETGLYDEKRFTVKHWRDTKQGGYAIKDERDIYELASNMAARRKRACILAVIPGDVVEAALEQIEVTMKAKMEITPELIASLLASFEKFGITKEQIEKRIQRRMDAITPALVVGLKKIFTSLKDGMSKPEEWFEPVEGAQPTEEPKSRTAAVTEKARAARPTKQEPQPAAAQPQSASGPEPITDEVAALLAFDSAKEEGEASAVLDLCKGQPFYARLVESFNTRFKS
jgi:hypothetical protein